MDSEVLPIRYKRWDEVPEGLISKKTLHNKGLKPGPTMKKRGHMTKLMM